MGVTGNLEGKILPRWLAERGPGLGGIMPRYTITRGKEAQVVTRTNDPLVMRQAVQLGFRVRVDATRPMWPEVMDKVTVLTIEAGRVEA